MERLEGLAKVYASCSVSETKRLLEKLYMDDSLEPASPLSLE
jgi:hypothetical protein